MDQFGGMGGGRLPAECRIIYPYSFTIGRFITAQIIHDYRGHSFETGIQ
jgi:hypothetical protein